MCVLSHSLLNLFHRGSGEVVAFKLPEVNVTGLARPENLSYVQVRVNDLTRCYSLIRHLKISILKLCSGMQQVRYFLLGLLSDRTAVVQSVKVE